MSLAAPAEVAAGRQLQYSVTLFNTSDVTVGFEECPVYDEGLKPLGLSVSYVLNCSQAAPIEPGGSETFAMVLNVPASAPAGPAQLTWGLEGSSHLGSAWLQVTAANS